MAHDDGKRQGKDTKTVDCSKPKASVQKRIDKLKQGKDGTTYTRGFCSERVNIVRDGVKLSGDQCGDGTIDGDLTEVIVTGAQRVEIEYFNLTGPGYGVLIQEGASASIRHSNIYDNEANGVGVYKMAFAQVEFNKITGNGRPEYFEAGIDGGLSVNIQSRGNYIANNAYAAIEIGNNSYFRSGLFVPIGGAIDPNDRDVFLQTGCDQTQNAMQCLTSAAPSSTAIDCFRGGTCDFRNTEVVGESYISGLSNYDVKNSSINGFVGGSGGSRLHLRYSVSGSGYVACSTEAFASSYIQCGNDISGSDFAN